MEAAKEEFIGFNDHTHQIVKRKRSKCQRSSSLIVGVTALTSSSSSRSGGGGAVVEDYGSITSTTTSSDIYESTEEEDEEDMANCLIMLAQGDFLPRQVVKGNDKIRKERFRARKISEIARVTTTNNKAAGFHVYECKTCNRSFTSFQALGGHRASHNKPKPMVMEEKTESLTAALPAIQETDEESQFNKITPTTAVLFQSIPNKGKIHECSICGSEFTSGQALGGHMRRHRANTNNNNNTVDGPIEVKTPARSILCLDLNLPAPEDDHHHSTIESKFQFATSTQPPLVFSAPALVDCHF
ncbi:zinc finger family protein [Tripterygium wilfordii]|uniref:Zinc finger family protein n=1 Tax=Tripterygium wilfordii TaxID=458696 RepID=A0A7J7BZZ7_TRIWF|nr:zinc finger protein ZAT5-like [Tripterygium wilfordii]KAF5727479.1 zinc finger family protein [Tripterygium wilfordii]